MKYVPPLGSSDENAAYVDGNPTAGIRGSVVPAAALEHPQREIMHVITQAGLEPSATTLTQLYQAITSIIGAEVPLASDVVAGLIKVGAGLAISEAGILSVPANAELEALRKSWIGIPRPWRSTTLPPGHVWANGGLVLFEDYPELEEVYDAGGFSGMLLAYDADEETIAANLGKWRPNSANPTGLYTPSLGGQFSRAWVPGSGTAGGTNMSGLPEIEGSFTPAIQNSATGTYNLMPAIDHRGAFRSNGEDITGYFAPAGSGVPMERGVTFAASRCSKIYGGAATVMPPSIDIPYILYLGVSA